MYAQVIDDMSGKTLASASSVEPAVKGAFENSGLFLESSLASGFVAPSSPAGVPDLKAALIVLRHTLLSLGSPPESTPAPTAAAAPQPQRPAQMSPGISAAGAAPEPQVAASPALAPSLIVEIDVEEVFLPHARLPVADDVTVSDRRSDGSAVVASEPKRGG